MCLWVLLCLNGLNLMVVDWTSMCEWRCGLYTNLARGSYGARSLALLEVEGRHRSLAEMDQQRLRFRTILWQRMPVVSLLSRTAGARTTKEAGTCISHGRIALVYEMR